MKNHKMQLVYFKSQNKKQYHIVFRLKPQIWLQGVLFTILYIPFLFPVAILTTIALSPNDVTNISDLLCCCNYLKRILQKSSFDRDLNVAETALLLLENGSNFQNHNISRC